MPYPLRRRRSLFPETTHLDIWDRQGIVLDTAEAFEQGALQEPNVLYEGDAQLLAGTVFKLWYTTGWAARDISYAESLDGIVWTKHPGNPILATHLRCTVLKDGATYVMYANAGGAFDRLTSADGITWAVSDAGVLTVGAGGEWDDNNINNMHVWIEGGTWYMLYDGGDGVIYQIGLARSTDNGVTWVKEPANPVIPEATGGIGGPWVTKVGQEYFTWGQFSAVGTLPTDIARFRSTNLVDWVRDPAGLVLERVGRDEQENGAAGQLADPTFCEVNGKTYMFYASTRNGAIALSKFKLAIANMPISGVVRNNWDQKPLSYAPNLLYNPSFDRLGAGDPDFFEDWTEGVGDGAIDRTVAGGEFRAGTSGVAAAKLTSGLTSNTAVLQSLSFALGWLDVGARYVFGGWARGDGTHGGRVRSFNTTYGDMIAFPTVESGTSFVEFSYTFTAPDAGNTDFRCYCPATNGGIAYFDDLYLRKVL